MANIMIIDDDPKFTENTSVILKKDGHSVCIHDTPSEYLG